MKVSRRGPQSFRVFLGSSHVDVVARKLNDGGLLVQAHPSSNSDAMTNLILKLFLLVPAAELIISWLLAQHCQHLLKTPVID